MSDQTEVFSGSAVKGSGVGQQFCQRINVTVCRFRLDHSGSHDLDRLNSEPNAGRDFARSTVADDQHFLTLPAIGIHEVGQDAFFAEIQTVHGIDHNKVKEVRQAECFNLGRLNTLVSGREQTKKLLERSKLPE